MNKASDFTQNFNRFKVSLKRKSALWIPESLEEFQNVNLLAMIDSQEIFEAGVWTGVKRLAIIKLKLSLCSANPSKFF